MGRGVQVVELHPASLLPALRHEHVTERSGINVISQRLTVTLETKHNFNFENTQLVYLLIKIYYKVYF